jgi:hypothetical protein
MLRRGIAKFSTFPVPGGPWRRRPLGHWTKQAEWLLVSWLIYRKRCSGHWRSMMRARGGDTVPWGRAGGTLGCRGRGTSRAPGGPGAPCGCPRAAMASSTRQPEVDLLSVPPPLPWFAVLINSPLRVALAVLPRRLVARFALDSCLAARGRRHSCGFRRRGRKELIFCFFYIFLFSFCKNIWSAKKFQKTIHATVGGAPLATAVGSGLFSKICNFLFELRWR